MHSNSAILDTIGGRPVLRFERHLRHSAEKVWKAITDPAEMAHWFPAKVRTELRAGARIEFEFDSGPAIDITEGEVMEFDPPKVYAYRWGDDVLRWEIVPDGPGCRLLFSHVLSPAQGGERAAGRNAAGWDECLAALAARLEGQAAEGNDSATAMLRSIEAYVERFGLGEGVALDHPDGLLVRFERDLVWQPIEHAWQLLTEENPVGSRPPVPATNGYVPAGPVTEVDPPRVLEYSWLHEAAPAGRVRWEFSSDPRAGTKVVLTQTLPARLAGQRATVLAAWQTQLELYFAALFGEVRCPWPAERTERLRHMYAERL